ALSRLGLVGRSFLLAVGSANPTKRQADLVLAWRALERRDARLVIVGGGDARVFGATALAEAPGVVRAGAVDDPTLRALYDAAVGLVFPSVYEGFGLPPLEAMACGCPVVAARAASLPEVCGDAAMLVPPRDPAALADAMRRLLDDAALRAAMRERGLARAADFSWDASAQALLAALRPDGPGLAQ
ncbi:MAG: glycosyltransferase family 4 protein, partial [Caldilineaceae bacterium]|nr:glycosyltransferase family 4 protein [Caldilineaceae bacterium]